MVGQNGGRGGWQSSPVWFWGRPKHSSADRGGWEMARAWHSVGNGVPEASTS